MLISPIGFLLLSTYKYTQPSTSVPTQRKKIYTKFKTNLSEKLINTIKDRFDFDSCNHTLHFLFT